MHQRLTEIVRYLNETRSALLDAFAAIPESQREERPADGSWTPAEVIDHLALVESGVALLVAKRAASAAAKGIGADPEATSLLASLDRFGVARPTRKLDAPEMVRPRADVSAAAATDAIRRSRRALQEAIHGADGFDLTQLKAQHAVLGEIDLYQWLLFVAQHESRHTVQLNAARLALAGR